MLFRSRLAKLHTIYGELSEKLEAMKAEARQTVHSKLEPLTEHGGELAARLESAKAEAQQKLRALYDQQNVFERRLLHSFPTLRSIHYPEAMKKWKEYIETRKK